MCVLSLSINRARISASAASSTRGASRIDTWTWVNLRATDHVVECGESNLIRDNGVARKSGRARIFSVEGVCADKSLLLFQFQLTIT